MKITLFISSLTGGGAERVLCNLSNYLIDKGNQVTVITNVEAEGFYGLDSRVSRYILLKQNERKNSLFNFFHCMKKLKKYVKENSNDTYVVFLPLTTLMLLTLRKNIKGRIVVSERGDPTRNKKILKFLLKKWICRADGAVFQTDTAKKWYEPYLKTTESVVIPNAINQAFIRQKFNGEREKIIVGVGRFSAQKNFPLLIRAFSKIANEYPNYKLVLYGKGALLESYKQLAEELKIIDRIEFPGYVPDMVERLEKTSMFVLSSDYEGMPNALMEAMALGLPVVSTDCGGGGAKFLIENEKNGLIVPQRDEEAMVNAMKKILSDQEFADSLGENARKLQEILSPEKIYGEWEKFIKK